MVLTDSALSYQGAAFERTGASIDDLIEFTPELRAQAESLVSKYKIRPICPPPVVSKLPGPLATLSRAQAGTNWFGGSFDPETHIVYVFSSGAIGACGLVPLANPKKSDMEYVQGSATSGATQGRRGVVSGRRQNR